MSRMSLPEIREPILLGSGKASLDMARAYLRSTGTKPRWAPCLLVPRGLKRPVPGMRVLAGDHPVPTSRSVRATEILLRMLQQAPEAGTIVFFISGGASALLEIPYPGLALEDVRKTTEILLRSGAEIADLNVVRKHLSGVKGGRLAGHFGSRKACTFILSDVEGDRPDLIGSGPTCPDPSTYADALRILKRLGIARRVPPRVLHFLEEGSKGKHPETPKPSDPVFRGHRWRLVGNRLSALNGVRSKARSLGWRVMVEKNFLKGEAGDLGEILAQKAARLPRGTLYAASGEPTVRVIGKGKGGRCQETALAFAIHVSQTREAYLLAAGTDGIDGPTRVAGAVASSRTAQRAKELGMNPVRYLRNNDSFRFFERLGDHLSGGWTGTNVNDLFLLLVP